MNPRITPAAEPDASRIADIHMAAFASNALLLAQFPTPEIRTQFRDCIASKTAADIRDPNIAVLVARDQEDQIISFAKWSLPVTDQGTDAETPWRWPAGSNLPVLEAWAARMEEAHRRVVGERLSYGESRLFHVPLAIVTFPSSRLHTPSSLINLSLKASEDLSANTSSIQASPS